MKFWDQHFKNVNRNNNGYSDNEQDLFPAFSKSQCIFLL